MPHLVGAELVKEGAVVLDVGINRVVICPACGAVNRGKKQPCRTCAAELAGAETKTVGDVDFAAVAVKAKAITPVPGGVGAVTNMMLARNTLRARASGPGESAEDLAEGNPPEKGTEVAQ